MSYRKNPVIRYPRLHHSTCAIKTLVNLYLIFTTVILRLIVSCILAHIVAFLATLNPELTKPGLGYLRRPSEACGVKGLGVWDLEVQDYPKP